MLSGSVWHAIVCTVNVMNLNHTQTYTCNYIQAYVSLWEKQTIHGRLVLNEESGKWENIIPVVFLWPCSSFHSNPVYSQDSAHAHALTHIYTHSEEDKHTAEPILLTEFTKHEMKLDIRSELLIVLSFSVCCLWIIVFLKDNCHYQWNSQK